MVLDQCKNEFQFSYLNPAYGCKSRFSKMSVRDFMRFVGFEIIINLCNWENLNPFTNIIDKKILLELVSKLHDIFPDHPHLTSTYPLHHKPGLMAN